MIFFSNAFKNISEISGAFFNFCKEAFYSRQQAPTLRIVLQQQQHEANNDIFFIVQITGKNLFPKLSANEAYNDKKLFDNFSKEDKNRIENAYKNRELLPMEIPHESRQLLYKLFSIESERESGRKIFKIELMNNGAPHLKRLTSNDIHARKDVLNKLSTDDIYQIGFHTGQESLEIHKK